MSTYRCENCHRQHDPKFHICPQQRIHFQWAHFHLKSIFFPWTLPKFYCDTYLWKRTAKSTVKNQNRKLKGRNWAVFLTSPGPSSYSMWSCLTLKDRPLLDILIFSFQSSFKTVWSIGPINYQWPSILNPLKRSLQTLIVICL